MRFIYCFIVSICMSIYTNAQSVNFPNLINENTANQLKAEEVMTILKEFHPIIKNAITSVDISKAEILKARGNFDPQLKGYYGSKQLENTNYYTDANYDLTIPTWYGMDLVTGYQNIQGDRTDNSQTTGGVSYLGVHVPLIKNLVYDKRRAALDQAKIMNKISVYEQQSIINDISYEAIVAYWNWVKYYEYFKLLKQTVDVNLERIELVRKSCVLGERPYIDTVEAQTQLISFQIQMNDAYTEFLNAGNDLSVYLWTKEGKPYALPPNTIPTKSWDNFVNYKNDNLVLENLIENGMKFHPILNIYQQKINYYTVDRKQKFQEILPKLDLNINMLNKGLSPVPSSIENYSIQENIAYGIKLDVPLRLSQGRGLLAAAKYKLSQSNLDYELKQKLVEVKIRNYFNDYLNTKKMVELQNLNFTNYTKLVKAEDMRFRNGESSLFLINSRENKALEAQEKLIDLKTKYFKTIYSIQWSAGLLR
jgi:outer membrane protein TolC